MADSRAEIEAAIITIIGEEAEEAHLRVAKVEVEATREGSTTITITEEVAVVEAPEETITTEGEEWEAMTGSIFQI